MKRILLSLVVALFSLQASAAIPAIQARDCKFFTAVSASADHTSDEVAAFGKKFDLGSFRQAAFQLEWSSLTGTVDGTFKLQVTNDPNCGVASSSCWLDKSSGSVTLSGANGTAMIAVTVFPEQYARVRFEHGSITGGTVTGFCTAKE